MNRTNNSFFSKAFMKSLFFTQNKWHQHGVLIHTLRVVYHVIKAKDYKLIAAAFLHDIAKPFVAHVKDKEDEEFKEYSFTDHEERSYEIIKNWTFITKYTKDIVRYHYLLRDIEKSKKEDPIRYERKKKIWDSLDKKIREDLVRFLSYDDLAKGRKRRE